MHGVLSAFDLIGFAAVLADTRGEIRHINSRAAQLCPDLFGHDDPFEADHRQALAELVERALDLGAQGDGCVPITVHLKGGRPLIVHAALAGLDGGGSDADRCAVLMLIRTSEPRELSIPFLKGAFGLTKSEVLLARYLCLGKSLKEIARIRDTSIATLRVQLRGLFTKTRTKRQAELVALLARLPPAPLTPDASPGP